jgi:peptidoglycan/xylan/chitin deacetylase (PgdA/CDA1 family)
MRKVVLRFDDLGQYNLDHDIIIEYFLEKGLCVTCGVVPMWLEGSFVDWVKTLNRRFPGAVEVHQHGYSHENHAGSAAIKYEFGGLRTQQQQQRDLDAGKRILTSTFGDLFVPVFSPPWGEFDDNTELAAKASGFLGFSSLILESRTLLPDFPGTIDLFYWHPTRVKEWRVVLKEWVGSNRDLDIIVFHPRFHETRISFSIAEQIAALISSAMCVTYRDLL